MRHLLITTALCAVASPTAARVDDMRHAIIAGDAPALAAALHAGADPSAALDRVGTPPVALAALRGEAAILRTLLEHGADPDAEGFGGLTALSMVVRSCRGTAEAVRILAEAGADPNDHGPDGVTPLMVTLRSGRGDLSRALIEAGADARAVDRRGEGVLNHAIYSEDPEMVAMALDAGATFGPIRWLFSGPAWRAEQIPREGFPRCD